MSVRLAVSFFAAPGKGDELLAVFENRCKEVRREAGREEVEIFQSALDKNRLVLIEKWADQAALDADAKVNATRPPVPAELRGAPTERGDYEYSSIS